jgi:hypothetical protein
MMRPATAPLAAVLALAGCGPSVEEMRREPGRFTMTVPVYWDQVATCLLDIYSSAGGFHVPDNRPVPSERRTELYLQIRGHLGQEFNVAMFDIRGSSQRESTVTFHRRKMLANAESLEGPAREAVERCGKAK